MYVTDDQLSEDLNKLSLAVEEADPRLAFVVANVVIGAEQSIANSFDRESQEPFGLGY